MKLGKLRLAFIFPILVIVSLTACQNQVRPESDTEKKIEELRLELNSAPEDQRVWRKLIYALVKRADVTGSDEDYSEAETEIRAFQQLNPDSPKMAVMLYRIIARRVLHDNDSASVAQIRALLKEDPRLGQLGMTPPSMLVVLYKLRVYQHRIDDKRLKELIQLMRIAIKEIPSSLSARALLSDFYLSDGRPQLALFTLQQVLDGTSGNVRDLKMLASAYQDTAFELRCDNPPDYKPLLPTLHQAVKLAPDDAEIHVLLAETYLQIGRPMLELFERRRAVELRPDSSNRIRLANTLFGQGQAGEAVDIYTALAKEKDSSRIAQRELGRLYFAVGDWDASISHWRLYFRTAPGDYLYGRVLWALAIEQSKGRDAADAFLSGFSAHTDLPAWQRFILRFHLREMDAQELVSLAKNRCEKTEAWFYTGMRSLIEGDNEQARALLGRAVDEGHPMYIETILAKYIGERIGAR